MNRPSFLRNVLTALVLAFFGAIAAAGLGAVLPSELAWQLTVVALGGAYLAYLLASAGRRSGRLLAGASWLGISCASVALLPHPGFVVGAQLLLLWLVRTLYFHGTLFAGAADLGLMFVAAAAGVWAAQASGSVFLTVWWVFLVQALFVVIPHRWPNRAEPVAGEPDPFERSHQMAREAVRRIVNSA